MNTGTRLMVGVGASALIGFAAIAAPAIAVAAPTSPAAQSVKCDTWITNRTGMASCAGGLYGGQARIIVKCADWWDPDVTGDWVRILPGERKGSADGLSGFCYGSVASVSAETKEL